MNQQYNEYQYRVDDNFDILDTRFLEYILLKLINDCIG